MCSMYAAIAGTSSDAKLNDATLRWTDYIHAALVTRHVVTNAPWKRCLQLVVTCHLPGADSNDAMQRSLLVSSQSANHTSA